MELDTRPKVLFTIPNLGWIRVEHLQLLNKVWNDERFKVDFWFPAFVPLENGQAKVIKKMLEDGYDYWANIDDDTISDWNILDLIDFDKDVISAPAPGFVKSTGEKTKLLHWMAYDSDEESGKFKAHADKDGLQEVGAIGGACFVIARRVFEHPDMQHGAFNRILNDDGTVEFGNDISFSIRAKKAGFRLWCHYDYWCHHYKEVDLQNVLQMVEFAGNFAERHDEQVAKAKKAAALETQTPAEGTTDG